jgi:uncharacterized membrane protein HdeD (DUF308 family)
MAKREAAQGMSAVRILAVLTLLLLATYHALRLAAAQCSGVQCDWYIAPSLLLAILIVIVVGLTGLVAMLAARRRRRAAGGQAWLALLAICTALGVIGPIVALAVLKDSPDGLVAIATVLFLLTPLSALVFSYAARSS